MSRPSDRLRAHACAIAWRQWTALGVAGVEHAGHRSVIDLEALLLFTGALGDADPRLRDEATDWAVQFGPRFVSATRLRNLLAAEPAYATPPCLEFLATVNAHAATRWPLPDDVRTRKVRLSGKSRLPDARKRPELLRLQLRAMFGTTARAEIVLAFLAGRPSPEPMRTAAELVATGYSKRNVALVLPELAYAGLLTERRSGNQVRYRLDRRAELGALAPGASTAVLTRWDLRFALLTAARSMFDHAAKASAAVASVAGRAFVDQRAATFALLDLTPPEPSAPEAYRDELAAWLEATVVPPELG
jgi:DNA-binding transcriptional ArsR family regulator